MKKYAIVLIALLCLLLCACNSTDSAGTVSNIGDSDIIGSDTGSLQVDDNSPAPNYIYPLHYNSVSEFKNSISKENAEKIYAEYLVAKLPLEKINALKAFVGKIQTQDFIVPCINGKVVDFRNKEGFYNISLFASEAYGLPWVFYYPSVSTGENFYIKTTCLSSNIMNQQNNLTASAAIKELSPNSPNIDNLGEQHKNIYNQTIRLRDREVTALICEYKTDNRNSITFIYNDLLVEIRCDPKVWTDQWFSALSFESLN